MDFNLTNFSKQNKIPNNVYQTFISKNLPPNIIKVIQHNKKMCPDYNFIFYDDHACDLFIQHHFDEKTYRAYKKINPVYGAMKADFFRYCILYKKGGVYLDIKSMINRPLNKLIHPQDDCLLDLPRQNESWRTTPTYEQWVLMFSPQHPYLLNVITIMVELIHHNYEPILENIPVLTTKQKILNVTGPDMFSKCIHLYLKRNPPLHRHVDYYKYFMHSNSNYRNLYTLNKKLHYSEYREPLYLLSHTIV
jgi:mannosyltransferase OCH1-like enzyme